MTEGIQLLIAGGVTAVVTLAVRFAWARIRASWQRAGQVIEDARADVALPPAPDLAFLGPPDGCPWCTDLTAPGDPRACTCGEPCQGIDWCNAGGWTTSFIPAVTEGSADDHQARLQER